MCIYNLYVCIYNIHTEKERERESDTLRGAANQTIVVFK